MPDARDPEDEEWMNAAMGKPPALVPVQLGAIYAHALLMARATARAHGYALAVHGSQMRDLDLLAVPWVEEASTPEVLVEAIRKAVNGTYSAGSQAGNDIITKQPHGRLTWAIHLEGVDRGLLDALVAGKVPFHPYLDLSVMPAESANAALREQVAASDRELAALSSDKQTLMTAVDHWRAEVATLREALMAAATECQSVGSTGLTAETWALIRATLSPYAAPVLYQRLRLK